MFRSTTTCLKNLLSPLISIISAFFLTTHCFAATIYDSSINWQDEAGKKALLNTVPKWHPDTINELFNTYQEDSKLPFTQNAHQYTIQFINSFWGPLKNPFNKYPRPAKIFLFPDNSQKLFNMALLIQDGSNGGYYVFEKTNSSPTPLDAWITKIKNTHHYNKMYFNVCNGYGNFPNDSCQEKNYQQETADAFIIMQSNNSTLSYNKAMSAYRSPYENWQVKAHQYQMLTKSNSIEKVSWNDIPARNKLLGTVTPWQDYRTIEDNFKKIRDIRYFSDETQPNFLRRISWLFPDDGCWTRGAAVIKDLFGPVNNVANQFSRPSKIFAFGNLCANTTNSPTGKVTWWYHTAPIIRDAATNQTYVLDPSINPYKPLTTENWITEITATTGQCKDAATMIGNFQICTGYGSDPFDDCSPLSKENFTKEVTSTLDQKSFRVDERERQDELGRDTNKVLGDQPPWLNGKI